VLEEVLEGVLGEMPGFQSRPITICTTFTDFRVFLEDSASEIRFWECIGCHEICSLSRSK
jgi:hypothetical protein